MHKAWVGTIACGMMISVSLAASAGHGIAWTMFGTACAGILPDCWEVKVQWSAGTAARVTLTEPTTGIELPSHTFTAREEFADYHFTSSPHCSFAESFDYRLADEVLEGDMFEMSGATIFCLDGPLDHVMQGTYTGHYLSFDITVRHPRAP